MDESCRIPPPPKPHTSSRIISGVMAYLSMHMENSCPRSAYLAALLLNRIADDPENDEQLRLQAQRLAEAIENTEKRYAHSPSAPTHRVKHHE